MFTTALRRFMEYLFMECLFVECQIMEFWFMEMTLNTGSWNDPFTNN
jgi:hypothetical protein